MSEFLPHVYGQEKVKKELSRLLEEDRLPHTLIFYGDEGLGKTTAALDLAAALAGTGEDLPAAVEAVPEEEWKKMPALTLAGERVWYLYPQGMELKIEQFRVFLTAMASFDEKPHVCIIDEAQTMMEPVANSLLKTLEEPEGNIHFILLTHDLDALLPTIVSRGERFGFYPLSRKDYHDLISAYPKKFTFPRGMAEDDLFQMSEGNPGITLEVCDEKGSAQPGSAMDFWEIMTDGVAPFARERPEGFPEDDPLDFPGGPGYYGAGGDRGFVPGAVPLHSCQGGSRRAPLGRGPGGRGCESAEDRGNRCFPVYQYKECMGHGSH
mgnify:CR=1 FL=1